MLLCTGQDSIWLEGLFCHQKYFPKMVPLWSQTILLGLNSFVCLLILKHSIRKTSFLAQTMDQISWHTQQILI